MNADDNGEGGTFALYSLLLRAANVRPAGRATHETDAGLTKFTTHEVPAKPRRGVAAIRHAFEHSKALQTVLLVVVLLAGAGVLAGMSIGTALARGGWLLFLAPPPPPPCRAACMVISDGVLTPAISVVSAIEGIQTQTGISNGARGHGTCA